MYMLIVSSKRRKQNVEIQKIVTPLALFVNYFTYENDDDFVT